MTETAQAPVSKSFVKTKITVDVYGTKYALNKPTVSQAEQLAKFSKEEMEQNGDALKRTVEFMEMMGLPKEVSEAMEVDQFAELVEFIVGTVKKK